MQTTIFTRVINAIAQRLDQSIGWHKLPLPLGLLTLAGLRNILREQNLHDTTPDRPSLPIPTDGPNKNYLTVRTDDGSFNDLKCPAMGMAGSRFGRNVPLDYVRPDEATVLTPNPRTVSLELLGRESFQPAATLNLLAAAWIQFMIHDWVSHGKNQKEDPWLVPLHEDDPWPAHPMVILRTRSDTTRTSKDDGLPPTYLNTESHWWDGSQVYGSDEADMKKMRSGVDGKLKIGSNGLLPVDPATGTELAGVSGNWWVGLSMMHNLFALEHNAICDYFRGCYPNWSDDELYNHARLVNVALMAKIHTVDWTTAILGHPTMQVAMRANWWGLAGEWISKHFGRISTSEMISGIPGSPKDHFGVPYSLTEEFVAVYRMHPLLPDELNFRTAANDAPLFTRTMPEAVDYHARQIVEQVPLSDLFYSFGTSYPGAISLHNYPRFLQQRHETDGTTFDLATTEIIRDRERGVPRYNQFRRLLHRTPVKSFEEITDNPRWVEELRRIYDNDIERVDLMVGMYAETKPQGFGFSDTAFRIFILMASRRLNSDRFFTTDYTPQVYTPEGLHWIAENNMATLLQRHFPQLTPFVTTVKNPFSPWSKA